jgi:ubiquinone/menaquinone biosynthesis C-methylase UbiE
MGSLLSKIEQYWDKRSASFSDGNIEELHSEAPVIWGQIINENLPDQKESIRALDIGTGPGFLAITVAKLGCMTTGVDYTEGMLEKARKNAESFRVNITFRQMDAHNLDFEDHRFDLIVSRNLVWNLEHPEIAYQDWFRVLAPGGKLIVFDGNWTARLFDEAKQKASAAQRREREKMALTRWGVDLKVMDEISRQLMISQMSRPQWDVSVLLDIGFTKVYVDRAIWKRLQQQVNTDMEQTFMIVASKAK